jgi:hypothetical protein
MFTFFGVESMDLRMRLSVLGAGPSEMRKESDHFPQAWVELLAMPDPESGLPEVRVYHELVARLSGGSLPHPLRRRKIPPGSKVQIVAWAYRLIERQKLRHREWSRRQAKGPFACRRRSSSYVSPEQKRERQRKYTEAYRAKVRKQLEAIRKWGRS